MPPKSRPYLYPTIPNQTRKWGLQLQRPSRIDQIPEYKQCIIYTLEYSGFNHCCWWLVRQLARNTSKLSGAWAFWETYYSIQWWRSYRLFWRNFRKELLKWAQIKKPRYHHLASSFAPFRHQYANHVWTWCMLNCPRDVQSLQYRAFCWW